MALFNQQSQYPSWSPLSRLPISDLTKYRPPVNPTKTTSPMGKAFPSSSKVIRVGDFIGKSVGGFLSPFTERVGAVSQSIKTKSLFPLKRSLQQQSQQYSSKRLPNETRDEYIKRLTNIALIFSVDSGLSARKPKDPLIQEARKYKSADEFVKAQGETLYHGSKTNRADFTNFDMNKVGSSVGSDKEGIFFTNSINLADRYTFNPKTGKTGSVIESYVNLKNPLVIKTNKTPLAYFNFNKESILKKVKKGGYDGVKIVDKVGDENIIVAINPSQIKTKSQLTDIWKKASQKLPKSTTKERGFITSVKEAKPELKVSGQYIPRSTDKLAIKARNLIQDDIAQAERLVAQGTDENAVATASELIKHYSDMAKQTADKATQNALHDKAASVANDIASKLTEQGRSVQAASIMGRLTPEGQVRFAAREIQKYNEAVTKSSGGMFGLKQRIPELTGQQADDIIKEMEAINKLPDGDAKAIRFSKLQDRISALVPTPLFKKITAVWKAGLLTGLKTSGLNIFANVSHAVSETAKDVPAVAVDSVASLFTGKRTIALTNKGTASGIKEGFKKGLRYFKTGYDERNIAAKLDYTKVNFSSKFGKKVLQPYEETIFRLLGSEDQPFYYGAKSRSMYSQAIAEGKNAGLKGKKLADFVDNLVQNPTDDILKNAVHDAEMAVFQNKTTLGEAAKKIQNIGGGAGEVVVPFGRTPAAVATQVLNYSPAGFVKTFVENVGKGRFNQRQFSQGAGRATVGTAAMWAGIELYKKGKVSLGYETDERKRNQAELEGRKPNSIKVGNKWRSAATLGPLGATLLIGGYFQRALEDTGSQTQAFLQAASGAGKSLVEQSFLQGLNQFTSAIADPERNGLNLLSNLISSTVPTLSGDIAKATDPYERNAKSSQVGIFASLKAKIPGLRKTLEPRINVEGKAVNRPGNPLETMFDPTRPSAAISTDLYAELSRLNASGNPATPTQFGTDQKYRDSLSSKDLMLLRIRAGSLAAEKLNNLIKSETYKQLSDEDKAKVIKDFTDKARIVARAEAINSQTFELSGDELKNKLKFFKETGFMTQEVFNKYIELYQ